MKRCIIIHPDLYIKLKERFTFRVQMLNKQLSRTDNLKRHAYIRSILNDSEDLLRKLTA